MRAIGEGFGAVDEVANGSGRHADYLRTATGIEAIADGKRARDRLLGIGEGAALLEVGCGLGDDARRLAALVGPAGRVVGLDASTALLERARSTPSPVEWVAGDVQALPFADATFDAARTERTLQHVADPDAAVAEMARVVRPGGHVVAEFYNPYSLRGLIKRWKRPTRISDQAHDHEVFTRYDTLGDVRRYLPPSLHVTDVRGVRVLTPVSTVHDLPFVGPALGALEGRAASAPLLRRLGGFMVVIAEKR